MNMVPIGLYIWMLDLQLVVLFGRISEDVSLLEEVCH